MKLSDIEYDQTTGIFVARASGGRRRVGDRLGYARPDGYRMISVDGKWQYEHRLAMFIVSGVWPPDEVDHVNGDRGDNRAANLRPCTRSQNMMNTRKRGVVFHKNRNKWAAYIRVGGKRTSIGSFATEPEAVAAYQAAALRLHGDFANIDPPKPIKQEAFEL